MSETKKDKGMNFFGVISVADMLTCRMLFVSPSGLEHAKKVITGYKQNQISSMTPDLWKAKKVVDSTLHPGMQLSFFLSEIHFNGL